MPLKIILALFIEKHDFLANEDPRFREREGQPNGAEGQLEGLKNNGKRKDKQSERRKDK